MLDYRALCVLDMRKKMFRKNIAIDPEEFSLGVKMHLNA